MYRVFQNIQSIYYIWYILKSNTMKNLDTFYHVSVKIAYKRQENVIEL